MSVAAVRQPRSKTKRLLELVRSFLAEQSQPHSIRHMFYLVVSVLGRDRIEVRLPEVTFTLTISGAQMLETPSDTNGHPVLAAAEERA